MTPLTSRIFEDLFLNYPQLCECKADIEKAFEILSACYTGKGKALICGNGGSAADSEHIVGELMKGFLKRREISDVDAAKLKSTFPEEHEYLSSHLQGALPAISPSAWCR